MVWETSFPDTPDVTFTSAPLAVKDKIIVGASPRNEIGRGYVAAYSAKDGKLLWKFLVVPEPGQPGSETWIDKRTIPTGGGGVWTEASYDPETNLAYFGTGNPVHMFDPQGRPGDNLYTSSIIALDVDSGELKWHFQTIPNEAWDYDAVAITQLYKKPNGNVEVRCAVVVDAPPKDVWAVVTDYPSHAKFLPYVKEVARSTGPRASIPRPASRSTTTRARACRTMPANRSATAARRSTCVPPTTGCRRSCPIPTTRPAASPTSMP